MTEMTRDRLVWVEIPATDLTRAKKFYEAVLKTDLIEDNNGPETMLMIPSANGAMCGHLYAGKPSTFNRSGHVAGCDGPGKGERWRSGLGHRIPAVRRLFLCQGSRRQQPRHIPV